MRALLRYDKSWAYRAVLAVLVGALAVGLWGRLHDLGFPDEVMWDETYFPEFANDYLQDRPFYDLHPPLGKFIIAASIVLFGNDPLAWRLTPAIFGCGLLVVGAFLGWHLFKDRNGERFEAGVGAVLVAAFFSAETMLIAYSRTGIMDGIFLFFILATFMSALMARRPIHVLWTAVLLGLAISVKWAAFPVVFPAAYVLWRKGLLRPLIGGLYVSAVLYLAIVFVGQILNPTGDNALDPGVEGAYFADTSPWVLVWEWHIGSLHQAGARVENPWGSPWWSWLVMARPIRFHTGFPEGGGLQVIYALGNPILWWASTLAVLAGVVEIGRRLVRRLPVADDPIVPIVLGYVLLLAPWVPGTRIPYIYNYLPSYAFAILALAYWACRLWAAPRAPGARSSWGPWTVVAFSLVVLASAVFFLPMVSAMHLEIDELLRRVWFDSWYYQDSTVYYEYTPPEP